MLQKIDAAITDFTKNNEYLAYSWENIVYLQNEQTFAQFSFHFYRINNVYIITVQLMKCLVRLVFFSVFSTKIHVIFYNVFNKLLSLLLGTNPQKFRAVILGWVRVTVNSSFQLYGGKLLIH